MHSESYAHRSVTRSRHALALRGAPAQTFGGLVAFVAVLLLSCGGYLLGDGFRHPVHAHDAGILTSACSIALGLILFFYLLAPGKSRHAPRPPVQAHQSCKSDRKSGKRKDYTGRMLFIESAGERPRVKPGESRGNSAPRGFAGDVLHVPR